jgi:hypothetical protein
MEAVLESNLTFCVYRVDEEEIEKQTTALRARLLAQSAAGNGPKHGKLKSHQVHEMAQQKIEETDKFRRALGISKDYEEGSHWRKQEERLKESLEKKEREEAVRDPRTEESVRERKEERSDDDDY